MSAQYMSALVLTKLVIAGFLFPATITSPGSSNTTLFLGGAGRRGLEMGGKFVTFTAIGVYLEEAAVPSLAHKWKRKTADQLLASNHFFRDIYKGRFEKLTKVTMVLPLTGEQYSDKLTENCIAYWKGMGTYNKAKQAAIDRLKEVLKPKTFSHGDSIVFAHSTNGSLAIGFLKNNNDSVPADSGGAAVIKSRALSEAVLESIIGKNGVSPAAKKSLAMRISALLM
ncbi:chalcone--flavonone isomerase [Iris pallida]|uniref:Chalcone-flavonone isomerase family protein n=1 Tax=Iris pallida TaxID=29817 RepID=A0AAX6EKY0_IRIPA|nr:chalcone--flavonone isomerase [Iris pallida]